MAKEHSRVNVSIWGDADFRALPALAQRLYLLLWTSPGLSYCGVHDWRPGRLAALAGDQTADTIKQSAATLADRHFVIADDDTEEILVRSWMRFDGIMRQPRMAVSCVTAYAEVASGDVRGVVVHELRKIKETEPDLTSWGDLRVQKVLDDPAVNPKVSPQFGPTFAPSLDQTPPSVCTPSTTATTTATTTSLPATPKKQTGRKRPSTPIPEDWKPTTTHEKYAHDHGLDLSSEAFKFRNHAISNDRRQVVWNAAFSTWLANALTYTNRGQPARAANDRRPEGW